MKVIEEKRRRVLADLGVGIRRAKGVEDGMVANQFGDIAILVEAAKANAGNDNIETAAIRAVESALNAQAKRFAESTLEGKTPLEKNLVGNLRENLLILLELAERPAMEPVET